MEVALHGPSGRTILGPSVLTIGRAQSNQLVINDSKASSRHAEIHPTGQGYNIIDLGSMNGTFVNEQRINSGTPRPLSQGNTIRIGDTTLTYIVSGAQQMGIPPQMVLRYVRTTGIRALLSLRLTLAMAGAYSKHSRVRL